VHCPQELRESGQARFRADLSLIERLASGVVLNHSVASGRCGSWLEKNIQSLPIGTCALLQVVGALRPFGPSLNDLVCLLDSPFHLSFSETQSLLVQLLMLQISCGTIANFLDLLSAALQQLVVYMDEIGDPAATQIEEFHRNVHLSVVHGHRFV